MAEIDPTDPMFRPVSIEQAMQITGRSRRTLDRWIHDGRLRVVRLDNPPEDVVIEQQLVDLEKETRDAQRRGRPPRSGPAAA